MKSNIVEVCYAHVHAPAVPGALDALVVRRLDEDPRRRPTTRDLSEQLAVQLLTRP
jgi:hypothetical protein